MIFHNIQDPVELEKLTVTSPFFKKILESRRQEYLFPKILPVFLKWYQNNKDDDSDQDDSSDDDDDEESTTSSSNISVLTLRSVCHCWNKSVESYILEHPIHTKVDELKMQKLKFSEGDMDSDSDSDSEIDQEEEYSYHQLTFLKFSNSNEVDEYMEAVPENQKLPNWNPIFHRKLTLQDPSRPDITKNQVRKFWESVSEFLVKYGKYIWYCDIRLQNNIQGCSYYFKVREWLELMPNLKVLNWKYPIKWEDLEDSEGHEFGSRTPIFLKCKLEDKVRENPLPKLEHLEMLKTDDLSYPIFREFIKRNDHIKVLQFHRKFPPPPQYEEFYDYDFANGLTNLTELSIILWRKEEIQELEKSASTSTWPVLQKLSMFWGDYNASYDGYNRWLQIFKIIEKKCSGGALSRLTLRLPAPIFFPVTNATEKRPEDKVILKDASTLQLNLPKLKTLKISFSERNTYLDFLLPLKDSLQHLHIILECYRSKAKVPSDSGDNQNKIIQFNGVYSKMLKSNIWNKFPLLRQIVFSKQFRDGESYRSSAFYVRAKVPAEVLGGVY